MANKRPEPKDHEAASVVVERTQYTSLTKRVYRASPKSLAVILDARFCRIAGIGAGDVVELLVRKIPMGAKA